MKKPNIILIGGGGHCKSCIDVIEQENKYKIVGIIDLPKNVGNRILGYPIIGSDDDLDQLTDECDYFLVTLGQIKSADNRIKLFDKIKSLNKKLPIIISPLAHVSKHATINEGTIVMHRAVVNAGSSIGKNCIINTMSLIEHDVTIGDNNHISTSSIINGDVIIGHSNTIGSNSTIIQNIKLSNSIVIGASSLVITNIIKKGIYVGTPVKPIK